MIDEFRWPPLSLRKHEPRLILFYTIINGLAEMPFECVLIEAYKGAISKHNKKLRHICHPTSHYGQLFSLKLLVHGTILLSPKLHHW